MEFQDFRNYLRYELNRSPHTVEAYCRDLRQFCEFIGADISAGGDGEPFTPDTLPTPSDIRSWLGKIASEDTGPRSLRRKAQSLRSYFGFLMRRKGTTINPAADLQLAKVPGKLPEFITANDMDTVLKNAARTNSTTGIRNRLILELLYASGLRQAELSGIKDSDINFHSLEIKVHGKRDKERIIPITRELATEIREWQATRDRTWPKVQENDRHLISGPSGQLSKTALYKIVKEALAAAGQNGSPHTLRHTFATAMLNGGASINSVKEFLGHSSLSTTQIYTHLNFRQMRESYLSSHPRAHDDVSTDDTEKQDS